MNVAKWLTEHGFRKRNGKRWSNGKVHHILTDQTVIGTYLYGQSRRTADPIKVEVPAVIPEEVFEAARRTLRAPNSQNTPPRVTTGPVMLSGIVNCGWCGADMTTTGKNGHYRYYTCTTKVRYGANSCESPRVPMGDLDDLIIEHVSRKLLDRKRMATMLGGLLKRQAARDVEKTENLARLREKLDGAEARLTGYYDAIDAGTVDPAEPSLKERIDSARVERDIATIARHPKSRPLSR